MCNLFLQEDTMKKWEENVRKVVPYTPGEQPKKARMIKLNTNENPYPPAPAVAETLKNFDAKTLRMYPDPVIADLVGGIASFYQVKPEEVFVGVGSDDVLAMIFLTFFNSKKPVLFPDITYSFYDVWADMLRIPYETIPLDDGFHICPEDYRREAGGVIFPNPNAPTGELLPLSTVETIIAEHPDVIVVVDEAYIDFGGESALPLIHTYDNLIVVQTFSKSRSLAGSRIGYAIANEKLIGYLNDVKYSFNSYTMDRITIELGTKAIADRAYFEETTAKIIATREWTKQELKKLGFVFGDSKSNFIFATHPKLDMVKLFTDLKQADIYVRHFNKPERIVPYLRISIGTDEEMQELIRFLQDYLRENLG
jgi:histidinol-phosphate aminotransferase